MGITGGGCDAAATRFKGFAMIIPPPPAAALKRAPFDTECFPNYWLAGIELGGQILQLEAYGPGARLSEADRNKLRWLLDSMPIWTFNGLNYDNWMVAAAIAGYSVEQLKACNDKIINGRKTGVKPWQLGIPRYTPADHIDIMEVIPGQGGQKYKAGIIHYATMQDLPYSPDQVLTPDMVQVVRKYNGNDLGQLQALADHIAPQIKLREKMTQRYGIDLRSKSDAQVAEAVLKAQCEKSLGRTIPKVNPDWNIRFTYEPPAYLAFCTPGLIEALNRAKIAEFGLSDKGAVVLPKELEGFVATINGRTYRMGIGGLHSNEECVQHVADDDTIIMDIDVDSYYPSMMMNAGAWPEALGQQFLIEFGKIKDERLAAKALEKKLKKLGFEGTVEYEDAHTMNGGGKIMINGTFGKTGSIWSVLFAPKMMVQTTLTGQLSLLMLIEWMESAGIDCVSANTDGIVLKFHKSLLPVARLIVKQWEGATGLTMEEAQYRRVCSANVNNYLAVKLDGEVKRKGMFAPTDLIMKKAPDCEICADAAAAFVADGTPVEVTILGCSDIRKFVAIQNVAGGAVKLHGPCPVRGAKVVEMLPTLEANGWFKRGRGWAKLTPAGDVYGPVKSLEAYESCFPEPRREPLSKVIRYYYAENCPGPIVYGPGKKEGDLVSDSYGAKPCMVLPDVLPADIDYVRYIERAKSMLRSAGVVI